MTFPQNSVLPEGSLILITGVNGLVASYTADEALKAGLKVRGTVRDVQKSAWIAKLFEQRYGRDVFELVAVPDLAAKGCLDEAAKGCDGLVHVAQPVSLNPNPHEVITPAIAFVNRALEAAAATPTIKRFVLTSSSASTGPPGAKGPDVHITQDSWFDASYEPAWAPEPYLPERFMAVYCQSKVAAERAMWKFVADKKPHFICNSVLPDLVLGAPIAPEQGLPSSLMVVDTFVNDKFGWQMFPPQYMVDCADTGRLHVAALLKDDVQNERVFGYAHTKTWTKFRKLMLEIHPEMKLPEAPADEGEDGSIVEGISRAESLLKWLGQPGFRPLKDSMKDAVDAVIAATDKTTS